MLEKLETLSPLAILKRGYSLTLLENGAVLRKKKMVRVGAILSTRIEDAVLQSKVTGIESLPGDAHE